MLDSGGKRNMINLSNVEPYAAGYQRALERSESIILDLGRDYSFDESYAFLVAAIAKEIKHFRKRLFPEAASALKEGLRSSQTEPKVELGDFE